MEAAVSITRLDRTAWELRKAASVEKNSAAARRILALALVLDCVDRKTAAEISGMDRQTLRDWPSLLDARHVERTGGSISVLRGISLAMRYAACSSSGHRSDHLHLSVL
jgi:hypothetical protein